MARAAVPNVTIAEGLAAPWRPHRDECHRRSEPAGRLALADKLGNVSKPRVTLATCLDHPGLHPGEEGLPDALADRGIDPRVAAWDDESVDWSEAGIVVLRRCTTTPRAATTSCGG